MALTVVNSSPASGLQGGGSVSLQGSGVNLQPAAGSNVLNNPNTKITVPGVSASNTADTQSTGSNATAAAPAQSATTADKSQDISAQNATLSSLPTALQASLTPLQQQQQTLDADYGNDATAATTAYNNETQSNKSDLQSNKQTALQDAVQGRQGLYGQLGALGALNGSGLDLANTAVAKGANEDLSNASDNYATNQAGLDSSYNPFIAGLQKDQQEDDNAIQNSEGAVKNQNLKDQQTALDALANDYQAEGDTANASKFSAEANALSPQIASSSAPTLPTVSGAQNTAWSAPTLQSYVGKANTTTVQSTPAQGNAATNPLNVPGLIATLNTQQKQNGS